MNLFINFLKIYNYEYSPLISSKLKFNLILNNLILFKFFNNFLKLENNFKINIKNFNFYNFLNSPININSNIIYQTTSNPLNIENSNFLNCFSNSNAGGAIFCNNININLSLFKIIFNNCSTTKTFSFPNRISSGGAIAFYGNNLFGNCLIFLNCNANSYGSAIYSQTKNNQSLKNTIFYQCGKLNEIGFIILMDYGISIFNYINISYCKGFSNSGYHFGWYPIYSYISFCNFNYNEGGRLIWPSIQGINSPVKHEFINIFNNDVTTLIFVSSHLLINFGIFKLNIGGFGSEGGGTITLNNSISDKTFIGLNKLINVYENQNSTFLKIIFLNCNNIINTNSKKEKKKNIFSF